MEAAYHRGEYEMLLKNYSPSQYRDKSKAYNIYGLASLHLGDYKGAQRHFCAGLKTVKNPRNRVIFYIGLIRASKYTDMVLILDTLGLVIKQKWSGTRVHTYLLEVCRDPASALVREMEMEFDRRV